MMFHLLLLTLIAVIGLGADDKPDERFGGDPTPKPGPREKAAAEQRPADLKEMVADLNRQLAEANKQKTRTRGGKGKAEDGSE